MSEPRKVVFTPPFVPYPPDVLTYGAIDPVAVAAVLRGIKSNPGMTDTKADDMLEMVYFGLFGERGEL